MINESRMNDVQMLFESSRSALMCLTEVAGESREVTSTDDNDIL